jgi:hypothetical protein
MLAAGDLEFSLYENVLPRSLCRLRRHNVRGTLADSWFPNRRRAERCGSSVVRRLAKTNDT